MKLTNKAAIRYKIKLLLLGAAVGAFVVHPLAMFINKIHNKLFSNVTEHDMSGHAGSQSVFEVLLSLFDLNMGPMATLYILLCSFIGYLYASKHVGINELIHELRDFNESLETTVAMRTKEIMITQKISIEALATLAEYNDTDTGAHLRRIENYTKIIANELKMSPMYQSYFLKRNTYVEEVSFASTLHDVGKIGIPHELTNKPSKLSDLEKSLMETHTTIAAQALNKANEIFLTEFGYDSFLALARDIANFHHENWDGSGYPLALKELDIPLSARIVAVADVYDALVSERPYKKAWNHHEALDEICQLSGKKFDPDIVSAFMHVENEIQKIAVTIK